MTDASQKAQADEQDASMDTILASIRRIIMEDEAGQPTPSHMPAGHPDEHDDDELLVLQPSMIVGKEAAPPAPAPVPVPAHPSAATQTASDLAAALFDSPEPAPVVPIRPEPPVIVAPVAEPVVALHPPADPHPAEPAVPEPLLAPAASQAAAQSLASLQGALRPEPAPTPGLRLLRSGGPTIEDMVREELRLQLKDWLDTNLPPLVERLVSQEIGRLVGRA